MPLTPEEIAKKALELDWKDVESQARQVCLFAAKEIADYHNAIVGATEDLKNICKTG